jgi:hypothetical protein
MDKKEEEIKIYMSLHYVLGNDLKPRLDNPVYDIIGII